MYRAAQTADPYLRPSFSLPNRMRRQAWSVCRVFPVSHVSRPFHAWRAFLLRCFGAQLGPNCHFYPKSRIWAPWNLVCADGVSLGDEAEIYNPSPVPWDRMPSFPNRLTFVGLPMITTTRRSPYFLSDEPGRIFLGVCAGLRCSWSERRGGGGARSRFSSHARPGAMDCLRRRSGTADKAKSGPRAKWNADGMSSCGSQLPLTPTVKPL